MSYPGEKRGHEPQQAPPVYTPHSQTPSQQQEVHSPMPAVQQPPTAVPQYYQQAQKQQHVYMNAMQVQSMPSVHQPYPVPMAQLPMQSPYAGQPSLQHAAMAGMPSISPVIPGIKPNRIIATIVHMLIIAFSFFEIIYALATGAEARRYVTQCIYIIRAIACAALLWVSWCAIRKPAFLLRPFKEMKRTFTIAAAATTTRLMAWAYEVYPVNLVGLFVITSIGSLYLYGITRGLDPESRVGYFFVP